MKKFTLIFAVMLMTSFAFAQKGFVPRIYELGKAKVVKHAKTNVQKATRAPGDVIWSEDFDSARWATTSNAGVPVPTNAPAGYSMTDLTGNGFFWRWSKEGPRGRYTSPDHTICDPASALHSTTESNGFLMFEADYFNVDDACNMVADPIGHDSYVQYDGLDFSANSNVVLRFEQKSRFCCSYGSESDSWFETSVDGTTWVKHDVSPTDINVGAENPTVTYLNLTSEVANQGSVSFRFHLQGVSHYHWEIDDISFVEPWQHDAWLHNYWNYDEDTVSYKDNLKPSTNFLGGLYFNPWFLTFNTVKYRGMYENFGSESLTNLKHHVDIYRNGNIYAQMESAPKTIAAAAWDSLEIYKSDFASITNIDSNFCTADTAWRTEYYGKYETVHYCTFDEQNDDASNDTMRRTFFITDTMFAYCDTANATKSSCAPDNWTDYTGDGDGVGFSADLPEPTDHDGGNAGQYYTLKSVNVYIPAQRSEAEALIAAGEAKLIAGVYKVNAAGDGLESTPFLSSAPYVLSLDDTTSWINIPFAVDGFSEILTQGGYYGVALQFYGSYTSDRQHTFTIGDDETRISAGGNALRIFNGGNWGWSYGAPAIILNIDYSLQNPTPNPTGISSPEKLKVDLWPNPSTGEFNVKIPGSKQITVVNAIGSTVASFTTNSDKFDLSNLESGVYFVRIKSGNKVGTQQVVIN